MSVAGRIAASARRRNEANLSEWSFSRTFYDTDGMRQVHLRGIKTSSRG